MANQLRFGLELEFHAVRFTLRRRADGQFWQRPAGGASLEGTMIALNPILQPLNPGAGFVTPANDIIWESDWGFRGVGDAFSQDQFTVGGANHDSVSTILELATAAAPVMNHAYWITSRKCSGKFVQTINDFLPGNLAALPGGILPLAGAAVQSIVDTNHNTTWIPLQSFINLYNSHLNALAAAGPGANGLPAGVNIAHFQLAKSQEILNLEAGNYPGFMGEVWDAFVCSRGIPDDQWCDVQVNYQIGLRSLYNNLDIWIDAWSSEWISLIGVGRIPVDPAVGDIKSVALDEPYRVQFFAAMWRRAKQLVDANFLGVYIAPAAWNGLGMQTNLMKALIMYVLVFSSVSNPLAPGSTTSKNRYPQLCKTSPQSIKEAITQLLPAPAPPAIPPMIPPGAPAPAPPVSPAATFWATLPMVNPSNLAKTTSDGLRVTKNLVDNGCLDPHARPANLGAATPRYVDNVPDIVGLPVPPFVQMWIGSLANHVGHPLAAGNKFGYDTANPFYCRWAHEVNSSYAARVFNVNDIKVLFESRYGRSMLNIGFNPYVDGFLFNRSYRRVIVLLAGVGQDTQPGITNLLTTYFPNGPLQQDFTAGLH